MYLIGIDAGTTLAKAGCYDRDGNLVALLERKTPEDIPQSGVYRQSGEVFFSIVLDLVKEVIGKAGISGKSVEAIGFSGQMGGAIGVDENWEPVTDWSNALDSRYVPYTTKMLAQCRDAILQSSGTNYPFFAPKILWWRAEYPELFKKARKFLILANYIAGRMSDLPIESAFMDQTYLQMTGIADIPNRKWNADICGEFDIDTDRLPDIVQSTDCVGKLNKRVADYCGLPSGIPLVAGAGDKPAAYLAAGMVEPGAMIDEAGSFSAFSLCTDRFVPDAGHRTLEIFPSALRGLYYPTMILLGSGTAHRWVTDLFTTGVDASDQSSREGRYAHLDRLAAQLPPGSEDLIAVGLLSGSGYPPEPDIRGVWAGFSLHHRREHFYRAILESYAYEYAKAFAIMKETYEELAFREIRVTGGGSKSSLWNRIKSDVLGCPLCELSRSDLTLLGNVILAGTGVGIYPDLADTVRRFTSSKREILPDQEDHVRYTKYIALYTSLLDKLKPFFRELNGSA